MSVSRCLFFGDHAPFPSLHPVFFFPRTDVRSGDQWPCDYPRCNVVYMIVGYIPCTRLEAHIINITNKKTSVSRKEKLSSRERKGKKRNGTEESVAE
jgi:hypothetical protein